MISAQSDSDRNARVRLLAPAKLNLFLEVKERRGDGYHEIETLMVAVSIYDTIEFTARPAGAIRLTCAWGIPGRRSNATDGTSAFAELGPESDNLAVQAAVRLRAAAGIGMGATIRLVKRIPVAAGLGGASSDAAAVLRAANRAWGLCWPLTRLAEVAVEIGSDVPFFLNGGAAVCTGRGEQIRSIAAPSNMHFVVVRPPEGLSTAAVYRHCQPADEPRTVATIEEATRAGSATAVARSMFNRLQPAATRLSPWIERTQREFDRLSFLGHQMSGSGTSYFGICRHARHARRMAARLRAAAIGDVRTATSLTAWTPMADAARDS